jgi:hypothetical protein
MVLIDDHRSRRGLCGLGGVGHVFKWLSGALAIEADDSSGD